MLPTCCGPLSLKSRMRKTIVLILTNRGNIEIFRRELFENSLNIINCQQKNLLLLFKKKSDPFKDGFRERKKKKTTDNT